MKILIVGEYSGFSKYLSEGFLAKGHEPFVISWGDGFKKIKQENGVTIDISNFTVLGHNIKGSHYFKRPLSYFNLIKCIKAHSGYFDCALIINPCFIKHKNNLFSPYPTIPQIKFMLNAKDNIYLSACGNDFIFNSFLPFRGKVNEACVEKFTKSLNVAKLEFMSLINHIKGVIPVMIDYAEAYRYFQKDYNYRILPSIPLPFNTSSVEMEIHENEVINIFHGVTRPEEKGSNYIIEAMKRIEKMYGCRVKINIISHLPLKEYLIILKNADILIDQTYAKSYGMNTIEGLAMGKVVLSGNEPGNAEEFGVTDCPVVNILPDTDDIYNKLEFLIDNRGIMNQIANKSVLYARTIHDYKIVARKYIEVFTKYNTILCTK